MNINLPVNLLAIGDLVAKERARCAVGCVLVESTTIGTRLCATDGQRLLEVVEGGADDAAQNCHALVHSDEWRTLRASVVSGEVESVLVSEGNHGLLRFSLTDTHGRAVARVLVCKPVSDQPVRLRTEYAADTDGVRVVVDAKALAGLLKTVAAIMKSNEGGALVELVVPADDDGCVLLNAKTEAGATIRGVCSVDECGCLLEPRQQRLQFEDSTDGGEGGDE